jgi:hypothetical protein
MINGDVVTIIANNTAFFNSPGSSGKSKMVTEFSKVAWFNFFGGPRDLLVAAHQNQVAQENEMTWVTTEMKHLYESTDHNS